MLFQEHLGVAAEIDKRGLARVGDADFMSGIVAEIIDESPDEVRAVPGRQDEAAQGADGEVHEAGPGPRGPKRLGGEALDAALVCVRYRWTC